MVSRLCNRSTSTATSTTTPWQVRGCPWLSIHPRKVGITYSNFRHVVHICAVRQRGPSKSHPCSPRHLDFAPRIVDILATHTRNSLITHNNLTLRAALAEAIHNPLEHAAGDHRGPDVPNLSASRPVVESHDSHHELWLPSGRWYAVCHRRHRWDWNWKGYASTGYSIIHDRGN